MEKQEDFKTKAVGFPGRAEKLIVHNATTLTAANDFVQTVKEMRKEVADSYDPIAKKAREARDLALTEKRKYDEPLKEAEKIIKTHIASYYEKLEEKRIEAEEIARKEEEGRQKKEQEVIDEAKDLEREGKYEEAEDKILEAPLPPKPVEYVTPEASGLTVKKILDTERINRLVTATRGRTSIPGIEVYPEWKWRVINRSLIPKSY